MSHPSTIMMAIEVANGRAIAKRPHTNMMTPQTIDQRVAILSWLTVVSEFIFVIQMVLPQPKHLPI
jgi:hypothetical protein